MSCIFELLQVTLGTRRTLSRVLSEEEWRSLYNEAQKQSIVGVMVDGLEHLPQEQLPAKELLLQWIGEAQLIEHQNAQMNNEAAHLTKLFEGEGHYTAILKGQANALLYPNPQRRQPGDIDIWVSGEKEKILQTLHKLNFINGKLENYESRDKATETYHHIQLPENKNGIEVEVHFRPSSGNLNPFTNHRLQKYLNEVINRERSLVIEGFYVPSVKFSLVMQLAHCQRHLLTEGVGMRQLMDYYYLLKSDAGNERSDVKHRLREFGLSHIAGAVMWVLKEVFGLGDEYLIAPTDERRGKMMLSIVMEGGNFGHFSPAKKQTRSWSNLVRGRFKKLVLLKFDVREVIWGEVRFIQFFIKSLPERIRRKSWSLGAKAK